MSKSLSCVILTFFYSEEYHEKQLFLLTYSGNHTGGTYLEQIDNIAKKTHDQHDYYAVAMYGKWEDVVGITKRFSLYKN